MGADDTLLYEQLDFTTHGIQIAPAEGNTPIPFHKDVRAEELSFPRIYCGHPREFKIKNVTYTDIIKSELLRYDSRACVPSKVLYSFKRSFNEKVRSSVQTFLRKKRGKTGNYTASQVRNMEFVKQIVKNDEGYTVWKNLRSSPSYWEGKCKTVVAMVRQLGKSTFFITLSAAEKKWPELIAELEKRSSGNDISESEAIMLDNDRKEELIRNDPVTCMRRFDVRFKGFKKHLLVPKNGKVYYLVQENAF